MPHRMICRDEMLKGGPLRLVHVKLQVPAWACRHLMTPDQDTTKHAILGDQDQISADLQGRYERTYAGICPPHSA